MASEDWLGLNGSVWREVMCKWSVAILVSLHDGPMNFSGLAKRLGVSNKVLSKKLRRLSGLSLISESYGGKGYMLTDAGLELSQLLKPLVAEGVSPAVIQAVLRCKWMPQILRALWLRDMFASELAGSFEEISWKVFSERMKKLEEFQLIHRYVIPSHPVRVKYGLEARGRVVVRWMLQRGALLREKFLELQRSQRPGELIQAPDNVL
ncbi:MAG: winged helix-turn-helix transcriptional regulator [Nitrososphaerota archaeon]